MDSKELKRIWRIEAPGLQNVINKVQELSKEIELQKAIIKEANKVLIANKGDAAVIEKQTKVIAQATGEILKLNATKRVAAKEAEMLVKSEERLAAAQVTQANATRNAAGSINEAAANYKALLALTRSVGVEGMIKWKDEIIGIDQAKAKLGEYRKTVDDFNRSLSPDGTLVGEYKKGIINAFADLGLTDLIKDQKLLIQDQISQLLEKNKILISSFNEVGRSGPKGFSRIPPEIERNIQRAQELEAQLMDINDVLKNQGGIGTQVTKSIGQGFKNIISTGLGVIGVTMGLSQVTNLLSKSFNTNLKLESMNSALKLVSKTETELAKNNDFLSKETERLGLELLSTTTAFKSFYTASTQSGIGANATREIFTAVASSAANLKISQEDVNGVFTAFGQIASKGKVQAEELRGQIGERIPGAFSIAARAIGVTEQELNKMMEKGEVVAQEFLPKFAAELQKTFGGDTEQRVEGLQASLNRFQNAVSKLFTSSSANQFYSAILSRATEVIEFFDTSGKSASDLGDEIQETAKRSEKYKDILGPLLSRYDELKSKTNLSTKEQVELQKIIDQITSIVPGAASEFDAYGKALDINKSKVLSFAEANDKLAKTFKLTNIKQLETEAKRALEVYNRFTSQLTSGKTVDEKTVGLSGRTQRTTVDLLNPDGTYNERGKQFSQSRDKAAENALRAAEEIIKNGGKLDNALLTFVEKAGKYKLIIMQQVQDINEILERKEAEAAQAFIKGDEKKRVALAKEIENLRLERQKLLDPTSVDKEKEGDDGGKETEEERQKRLREAYQKNLGLIEDEYLSKQIVLFKKFNKEQSITEEQYLQGLYDAQKNAADKKIKLIQESSVAEKSEIQKIQFELLKAEQELNDQIFEERKKALERRQQEEIDAAEATARAIKDDPSVSEVDKAQTAVDLTAQLKTIQQQFNADMDALEKEFKQRSEENARERNKSLIAIEEEQRQNERKLMEEKFSEQLDNIRAEESKQILTLSQELEANVSKILGSSRSPKQKAQDIEKLFKESELRMLDVSISTDTQELEIFQKMVDAKMLKQEEFEEFLTELSKKRIERNKAEADAEINEQRRKEQIKEALISGTAAVIDTFLQGMFDNQNSRLEKENEFALNKLNNEKEQALAWAQNAAERESIEKQYEAKKREQEKIAFDKKKEQRKKEILIEAAFGAAKAIAQNPPPSPLGLIQAAVIFAQAALQSNFINKQQFEFGGMPKKGGKIGGRPHSAGGTPFTFGGETYEAEVGELAIIRTKNAPRGSFNISGTHEQIASALNVIGGGVNFRPGARFKRLEYGGSLGDNLRAPVNPAAFLTNSNDLLANMVAATQASIVELARQTNNRIDRIEVVQDPRAAMRAQGKIVKNDSIGSL